MKSVVGEVIGPEARRLNNTMKKLTTDVALLKAENEGLRRTVRIERSCRRRDKPLFDNLEVNDEAKGMFLVLIRFRRPVIVKFKESKRNSKLLFKRRMKRNKESLES